MRIKMVRGAGSFEPVRGHKADAGLDLRSPIDVVVPAHGLVTVDTGIHLAIPPHFCGILKSKSGLNVKHGIQTTGTIDSGYTGSIAVTLVNHSDKDYKVFAGDKITQIVILHIPEVEIVEVDHLSATERGDNGFGSTGR